MTAMIALQGAPDGLGPKWNWDGNREAPTLTPSLYNLNCGWHGFLRAGKFTSVA